ncbi:MAG: OsmC family protein [Candidatus Natronoplasma sp.]
MTHEYTSIVRWSDEEDRHGSISMDCGYSCDFHKPMEFGGTEGVLNPEDTFVGSLAMCYSITLKSTLEKMRMNIEDFELETRGVLEDTDEGSMITEIEIIPRVKLKEKDDRKKLERALELAKKNCLISNSMKSEIRLKPEISNG